MEATCDGVIPFDRSEAGDLTPGEEEGRRTLGSAERPGPRGCAEARRQQFSGPALNPPFFA